MTEFQNFGSNWIDRAPVASAQYHFTAIFSPPQYAAFISWMQGRDLINLILVFMNKS
jgi:hypothetical protein